MRGTHRAVQVGTVAGLLVLELLTVWRVPWTSTPEMLVDLGVAVVALAMVPLILSRPVLAGAILGVLVVASPVATPAATCAALVVALSRPFRSSAGVALVGVAGHLLLNLWRPQAGLSYGWWAFLVVVSYATLVGWGAYLRARRELVASLRERAERAEAEQAWRVAEARATERARIAREMHDVLAHRLSLVATHAGALEYRPDAAPEQIAAAAGVVRAGVHQALAELREVVLVLRDSEDPTASGEAILAPPQPTLSDLPRLLEDNAGAGASVEVHDPADTVARVPTTPSRTAYRIVQEGLTNSRRHAPGQPVTVTFDGAPGAVLEVRVVNALSDSSESSDAAPAEGFGLVGLAERVQLAGGTLSYGHTPGRFEVVARIPWPV